MASHTLHWSNIAEDLLHLSKVTMKALANTALHMYTWASNTIARLKICPDFGAWNPVFCIVSPIPSCVVGTYVICSWACSPTNTKWESSSSIVPPFKMTTFKTSPYYFKLHWVEVCYNTKTGLLCKHTCTDDLLFDSSVSAAHVHVK